MTFSNRPRRLVLPRRNNNESGSSVIFGLRCSRSWARGPKNPFVVKMTCVGGRGARSPSGASHKIPNNHGPVFLSRCLSCEQLPGAFFALSVNWQPVYKTAQLSQACKSPVAERLGGPARLTRRITTGPRSNIRLLNRCGSNLALASGVPVHSVFSWPLAEAAINCRRRGFSPRPELS